MLNRVILAFIVIIFIGGRCYSNEIKQQEPLFESDDLVEAIEYTCVDISINIPLQTPNWIHYQNSRIYHSVIFHKTIEVVIVRMGNLNIRVYIITGRRVDIDHAWWSVYEVDIEEEDCLHTRLYKEMIGELKDMAKSCLRTEKDFI